MSRALVINIAVGFMAAAVGYRIAGWAGVACVIVGELAGGIVDLICLACRDAIAPKPRHETRSVHGEDPPENG